MKLSLKQQLAILVLAPFLVVIFGVIQNINSELQSIRLLNQSYYKQECVIHFSNIIHELQKERDFAVVYSNNPLVENQLSLNEQFNNTDSIVAIYHNFITKNKGENNYKIDTNFIYIQRNKLTWSLTTPEETEMFYNNFIDLFIETIFEYQKNLNLNPIRASFALIQSIEYSARIRNRIHEALTYSEFTDKNFAHFAQYKGAFELGLKNFNKYASEEVKSSFELNFHSGSVQQTLEIIDSIFINKSSQYLYLPADSWWFNATNLINLLHQNLNNINSNIQYNFILQIKQKQSNLNALILKTSALILGLLLLWWIIIYQINKRINLLKVKANKLSLGDTSGEIYFNQNDSISELANSLNLLSKSAENFAKLANSIGSGNYNNPVKIRSEADVLGIALEEMRKNLNQSKEELNLKYNELDEANAHKSIFLANISHELRTPLNSIVILAQLLNESKNLSKDEMEFTLQITKSAKSLMELINDILDYSKVELGKENIHIQDINLNSLIDDVLNIFTPLAKEKNIRLEIVKDLYQNNYSLDGIKISQILQNLLSNAIKFTPENGLVFCSIKEKGNCIEIIVKDTGIGISNEHQSKIFSPFFQVDDNLNKSTKGTGLGLSIVKKMVLLLKGKIQLQSYLNHGTTFTIILPLNETEILEEKKIIVNQTPISTQSNKNKTQEDYLILNANIIEQLHNKKVLLFYHDIRVAFEIINQLNSHKIEVYLATEENEIDEIISTQKINTLLQYVDNDWLIKEL
jgi:signal transduction histidine kinase